MGLEKIVNGAKMKGMKKCIISSDWHIPYIDDKAFDCHLKYVKKNKPDIYVVNGDMLDFYSLSKFDKDPIRKEQVQDELDLGEKYLKRLNKVLPRSCDKYYLKGNHESRLQKYLWQDGGALSGVRALELDRLLKLDKKGFKFIDASHDYWKVDSGHLKMGDMLIAHGDSRLNGFSLSKYSGYSAKNSMMAMMSSIAMGHGHRLAVIYHTTPNGILKGIETGSLCMQSGTSNWQQGFASFNLYRGKTYNHRVHHIEKGKLVV